MTVYERQPDPARRPSHGAAAAHEKGKEEPLQPLSEVSEADPPSPEALPDLPLAAEALRAALRMVYVSRPRACLASAKRKPRGLLAFAGRVGHNRPSTP